MKKQYGWAACALLGSGATFAEIEEAVGMDAVRPFYGSASHAVHPNARGSFYDPGIELGVEILLAGPSTRGLAEPGIDAVRSRRGSGSLESSHHRAAVSLPHAEPHG